MNNLEKTISSKSLDILRGMGSQSFICCPIIYETESMGVLVVDNIREKKELTQTDISLLTGIAPQIGISIHNARMVNNQKKQFNSILRVLAASIDARDPLTAGHSEKVTEYAVGIARILELDGEFCEMIGIAGLLHDYGKIGVRDDVLKKPGKLTDEEFTEIRSHVEQTRRILEQMEFEGIFNQIPSIAGFHHEKVDGSGYPMGLKGEEIPLGARIIAVADVFEALTAERHYRQPMKNEDALEIIQKGSGNAFDPQVVEAFDRYYHNHIGNSG
jgi:HD-GYP domain-containing protein (c-di-GMP phosphodiesterase class II)